MIERWLQPLPHGITLSCRAAGRRGRPVLLFLHGFPEAAFVWDELLEHFADPAHGGYRCVAPNLRGYEQSSQPAEVEAYRARHLVRDVAALIETEGGRVEALVAHDWGGAVAWNLANQRPELLARLAIVNSPHPGAFLRELKANPRQQQASAYMNFLIRPDAEELLRADDYRRMFRLFGTTVQWEPGAGAAAEPREPDWLTPELKARYRTVWDASLTGALNWYRASPLRPPRPEDSAAAAIELPDSMLTVEVPTLVLWGLDDVALPPELAQGLEAWIPDLRVERVPGASHWIVHEQPDLVADRLGRFLAPLNTPTAPPPAAS